MRFDLLEAFELDPHIIAILKEKYGPELLPIQEKAIKERHALLVINPKLLAEVELIVVDELQYISEEDRIATLELLLTKILLSPERLLPQLIGLSAVLGKAEKLAEWLNAQTLVQEKRPVELRKGVFFDGKFSYSFDKESRFLYCCAYHHGDQIYAAFLVTCNQILVFRGKTGNSLK